MDINTCYSNFGDIKCWWWIIDWFNGDFDRTEESVGNGAQLPSLTTANDDDDNNKEGNGTGVAIPMSCELHKSQQDEDGVGTEKLQHLLLGHKVIYYIS